ncbi:hypothetical protein N657DRAFT_677670 [Parathielavia appendiculata]|uniref:Uncharacterized protein n=1 Tax=Parathielavia appendiculata TaxID=2587402 RepID=A0AAN6Z5Z4_9PEZI|nr:hypothetical protein N657DRAFT_677670 [Parathielavia appendiculata]
MPPQYWAGRFMALHDRFHNELLEPFRLARINKAQIAKPSLPPLTSKASAAAQNNPSTSIYSVTRVSPSKHIPGSDRSTTDQDAHSRQPSRIPQSATSGAILQRSSYSSSGNSNQPDPESPFSTQSTLINEQLVTTVAHKHPLTITSKLPPSHPSRPLLTSTITSMTFTASATTDPRRSRLRNLGLCTATTSLRHIEATEAEAEGGDEARVRRALAHLERACLTDAARLSLRQWRMAVRINMPDNIINNNNKRDNMNTSIRITGMDMDTSLGEGDARWSDG